MVPPLEFDIEQGPSSPGAPSQDESAEEEPTPPPPEPMSMLSLGAASQPMHGQQRLARMSPPASSFAAAEADTGGSGNDASVGAAAPNKKAKPGFERSNSFDEHEAEKVRQAARARSKLAPSTREAAKRMTRARVAMLESRLEDAHELAMEALERDRMMVEAHVLLGEVRLGLASLSLGKWVGSVCVCGNGDGWGGGQRARETVAHGIVQVTVRQGRLHAAAGHFERAIECAPEHAPAHYQLGRLLLRQTKLPTGWSAPVPRGTKRALKCFRTALA